MQGSDHGWEGKSTTIYSGAIRNGPFIVGNIAKDAGPLYPGPWGSGAPVRSSEGKEMGPLHIGHLHATMSHLLRVENPIANASSLVHLKSNKALILKMEKTKLV